MQVNIKHEEVNKKNFDELSLGQVFLYMDEAWVRIACAAERASDEADDINAVCLSDGDYGYFYHEEVILPKVAELNIEY